MMLRLLIVTPAANAANIGHVVISRHDIGLMPRQNWHGIAETAPARRRRNTANNIMSRLRRAFFTRHQRR